LIKLDDLFARPGYAPKDYQVTDSAHFFQQTACKPPVRDSPDLRRILALPTRPPVDEESDQARALVRMMTARYAIQRTTPCRCTLPREQGGYERDCITTLNLTQAWALYELGIVQGLVGPIGVGHGKTILDILAILAMMPPGEPNPSKYEAVLLVPPGLVEQLVNEYLLIREHFRVPSLAVHGRDIASDAGPGAPVLHVLPYSRLQRPEATVLLERIKPRAIISDEAHGLRNPEAVRTGRVIRYLERFPATRFACWTGSITDSSIGDYCVDPATRVLTADLRWVRADNISPGLEIVGFDEEIKRTKLRRAVVENVRTIRRPRYKITTDRGEVTCSDTHRWVLRKRPGKCVRVGEWIDARDVRVGDVLAYYATPWETDESREAGYLAGLLDGEGWISAGKIGFGQKPGLVLERYKAGLDARGFAFKTFEHKTGVVRVHASGESAHLRLLGILRPSRLLAKASCLWEGREPSGRNTKHATVTAVEYIGEGSVIAMQTSTRTLIAEGFLTHNSHLSKFALGQCSPLPLDAQVVKEWATALDPKSEWPADAGALLEGLIEYGFQPAGSHVHVGFHKRLSHTEGVVATRSSAIKAKLEVSERVPPQMPHELSMMLDNVREIQQRPDGEELITPLEISKCARELACGFYYKRIYPEATDEELEDGGLVDMWELRRAFYRREVRERLKDRREHLDSPYLCQLAAMRYHGDIPIGATKIQVVDEETGELVEVDTGKLPSWKSDHWPAWRDIKDKVKPDKETVWVDEYLAVDAAQWARENRGIVWYDKTAFGLKVAELSGLPLFGGGANGGGLLDPVSGHIVERGDRSIILSIKAHGTGRDGLQMLFWTQLVANPPSSSASWEQLLGRLHRIRQRSDLVSAFFYCHTEELERSFAQAQARAQYVQGTIGAAQKLSAAFEDE